LNALEGVRNGRKGIALGPRPGPKIRSGVVAPKVSQRSQAPKFFPATKINGNIGVDGDAMIDLDDD
jgi:minichromosome maintenance protein 10